MEYIGLLQTEEVEINQTGLERFNHRTLMVQYDSLVQRIVTSVDVSDCTQAGSVYRIPDTIWDTGATTSVISERVARKIGLRPIDTGVGITPSGQIDIPYYIVDVYLSKDIIIPNVKVAGFPLEKNGASFLIGMDIISKGNLKISNVNGTTRFEFQI